ncbi:MAG TPA: hypothetical protein DCZ95_02480 [Verrucomicrobia bacterium]|nr:MAG: hypothetical protein A2X46_00370 [Lentisphaerae bacterium GWF2_57_35]HBA82939.1 hypothetical protein [Verrucomicrobiota bacterium]
MKWRSGVLFVVLACLYPYVNFAQIPELVNYQGRLLQGTNLANGVVALAFRCYTAPSGGLAVYSETQSVVVVDGFYTTQIGLSNAIPGSLRAALTNTPLYLEIAINSQALAPRERIVAVSYACLAGGVTNNAITSAMLSPNAVTTGKIAAGAVGSNELATNAVTSSSIANGSITSSKLATGAVGSVQLAKAY